ncbi:hypothetical protein EDB87DRAFT_8438 [Lactarius vividus]|nr:hypothetical protein EDB87DRAFT_8438 [Lactarius vividus]
MAFRTLGPIRNVYVALHQDTDSAPTRFSASTADQDDILREPSSYPICNVAGHFHDDSISTSFTLTALHDGAAPVPASLDNARASPSLVPGPPPHAIESPTDAPSLDNSHLAHQTNIEGLCIPVPSPNLAAAGAIRDTVTSGTTIPTPEPSASAPVPLQAPVAIQHNLDFLKPFDEPNLPSSATSNTILDHILPTDPSQSSCPPTTRSDLSSSGPEPHRLMIVTPSASPEPTSVLNLGAVIMDDGIPKPGLCKEQDTLDHPSVDRINHANAMTTLDLPPQSRSLPSVTDSDVAIAIPSLQESNAECTGHNSPRPSHRRYEIV